MLLTQLTLGLWILSPIHAVPPTAQPHKTAASHPTGVRAKVPTARRVPPSVKPRQAASKARPSKTLVKAKPKTRTTTPPRRTPAVHRPLVRPSSNTGVLTQLPKKPDPNVQVISLGNGVLAWCQSKANWHIVEVRIGIAAGTANDPKGLFGRSRFLAHMLRKQLNQPKNPARSLFPPGDQRYRVILGKDWVEIRLRSTRKQIPSILSHIAQSLHTFQKQPLTSTLRGELAKTASSFPPPMLSERVDAFLFGKQSRGALLRGRKSTFRSIQRLPLQTAYEALYSPNRMRVLVVGGVDCNEVKATMHKTWMILPRGKHSTLYTQASPNPSVNTRSLLVRQQLFSLYQLPALHRQSYIPLQILQHVALRELSYQMNLKFGNPFPIQSYLQPSAKNGFLVVAIPAKPLSRGRLQKHIKQTLGELQMKRYRPTLEQRVQLHLRETQMKLQQMQESSAGVAQLLWPQLLLPPQKASTAKQPPSQLQPILKTLKPTTIRQLALLFMARDLSLRGANRPLSMQRIALFIGTIILVWLLLDIILRRTRRTEE